MFSAIKKVFFLDFRLDFAIKKDGWFGGGTRSINFVTGIGNSSEAVVKVKGNLLTVEIATGLPSNTRKFGLTAAAQKPSKLYRLHKMCIN